MVSLLELAFLKTWLWNYPRQNAWGSRASHVLRMQIPGPHRRIRFSGAGPGLQFFYPPASGSWQAH